MTTIMVWVASTATGKVTKVDGGERPPRCVTRLCSASLCVLARARVPRGASPRCALALALAAGAGQEIGAAEPAVCVECGLPRGTVAGEIWRRSWTGEPLCADCGSVLELDGELKAFAALAPARSACFADRAGDVG
ncbi:hypothetical protein HFP15_19020 [Amycolatopsis sp. K13G38]|uniref:GATA-type domain-containing protein n=1 Tax=Amycolatopsis acididurans TaxID=2724524 RepID=A0ABX1J5X4_9PSEU|nr:hypothetical protein [Amycolatopsis acididurans]NKQ54979.1 hypothetical protein [Amycolatopsis acididurans]